MPRTTRSPKARLAARPGTAANQQPTKASPETPPGLVTIGDRQLKLSNLHKVLYPKTGFTKGQVIDYYARIAPAILPHLRGRPITLKRYPDGVEAGFFYEKMCPSHRPDWVNTVKVVSTGGKRPFVQYCVVDDAPTLIWIANLASIELHTLLSRQNDVLCPTMMVFDLDPGPGITVLDCCEIAVRFHDMLKNLGLESFPKTSGGKGIHLYIPLNTPTDFEHTKNMALAMAQLLERDDPKRITTNMRKEMRAGRVFIDWSQNDDHKTTVCVYSLRARENPTVSTPVSWDEIRQTMKRKDPNRLLFTTDTVLKRVKDQGDLFDPVLKLKQQLPKL